MSSPASRPIGVYDSGVGGLSVLREIRAQLPGEPLVYVADTAHVPYGEKSADEVAARALAVAGYFAARGARAMAVPCNTATAAAVALLRERHPGMPIVGIEPAVKPAAALTRSGTIGVLATTGTLASARFRALVEREAPAARILLQPCPDWVLAVEAGVVSGPEAAALVAPAVRALLEQGADVLVLGCTHFPFLREAIAACAGPQVPVLETGAAVARQLRRRLAERDAAVARDGEAAVGPATACGGEAARAAGPGPGDCGLGDCQFLASGDPAGFARIAGGLLGAPVRAGRLPREYC